MSVLVPELVTMHVNNNNSIAVRLFDKGLNQPLGTTVKVTAVLKNSLGTSIASQDMTSTSALGDFSCTIFLDATVPKASGYRLYFQAPDAHYNEFVTCDVVD